MKAMSRSTRLGRWAGVLTLGTLAGTAFAQKVQMTFDYGFPSVGEDLSVIPASGTGVCEFAIVGTGRPITSDSDVIVSRHTASGGSMWSRRVAGAAIERATCVAGAVNGDILAAFTSNRGISDMATVIARFDSAGNLLWANHYPGALDSQLALAEAANGDVVAVSEYLSAIGVLESVFVRVTPAGVPIAIRRYAGDPATGTQQPRLWGLHEFAGFWYLLGSLTDATTQDSNVLLMAVDATGIPAAALGYATTFPGVGLVGRSIDVDPVRGLAWTAQVLAPFPPPLFPSATLSVQSDLLGGVVTTNVFFDSIPGRKVFWDPNFSDAVFSSSFLFPIGVTSGVATRDFGGGAAGNSELYYDIAIPNLSTSGNSIVTPACDQDVAIVGAFQNPATPSGSAVYFIKAESVLASGCRDFAFTPQTLAVPLVQSVRSVIVSNDVRVAPFTGVFSAATPVATLLCTTPTCPRPQPACPADLDDGSMTGTPDGGVTVSDLLYFLNEFGIGTSNADVDDGLNSGDCDGGVTISDLLYYLTRFQAGC